MDWEDEKEGGVREGTEEDSRKEGNRGIGGRYGEREGGEGIGVTGREI